MTSILVWSGDCPISIPEIREAIGLQSPSLDGLIAAAIISHALRAEIIPQTWEESESATNRQRDKGLDPFVIFELDGKRLVTYVPDERRVAATKQKIVAWLLQQDDVHFARLGELPQRLDGATISISAALPPEF